MNSTGRQRRARARMTTAPEAGDLYSSPPQQPVQDHRLGMTTFEASPPERTTTAVQSRRHSMDSLHSDQLEATTETCSCGGGGGGVCSDDCCTTADRSTSLNSIVSIKPQMQNQTVSVCPSFLDSGDSLIKLPDDLIREVLKKISIKEKVRMGCLNTAWNSKIRRLIGEILDSGDRLIKLPDDLIREVLKKISIEEKVRMGCLNRAWSSEIPRLINGEGHDSN